MHRLVEGGEHNTGKASMDGPVRPRSFERYPTLSCSALSDRRRAVAYRRV